VHQDHLCGIAGGKAEHGGEFTREQAKLKLIDYACGRLTVEELTTVGELIKTALRIAFRDWRSFIAASWLQIIRSNWVHGNTANYKESMERRERKRASGRPTGY